MIVALLAMLLQSGPAAPQVANEERICTASATGRHGARVDVSVEVTPDRAIFTQNVGWSPPKASSAALSRPGVKAPALTLYYEYAQADDIDDLSSALGEVSSVDAPAGTFDDMALAVRIDQGDTWYVALDSIELDPEYRFGKTMVGGTADDRRSAWLSDGNTDIDPLEALETARSATLSLVNRKGHPVSQISYDISATAERDRLFTKAWKKAEKLAQRPARCTPIADE
jgi:hypothetical protein